MSRLDEIKARAEQVHWTSTSIEQAMARMASSAADVPWLLAEVERLTAERDALIAVGKRQAARLARVEALAEEWDGDDSCDNRTCVPHRSADALRAALAGSEADTSGAQTTDPGCGCSTNPARARYADGDPAGCYCTCSDDAREGCEHEPDEPQSTDQDAMGAGQWS